MYLYLATQYTEITKYKSNTVHKFINKQRTLKILLVPCDVIMRLEWHHCKFAWQKQMTQGTCIYNFNNKEYNTYLIFTRFVFIPLIFTSNEIFSSLLFNPFCAKACRTQCRFSTTIKILRTLLFHDDNMIHIYFLWQKFLAMIKKRQELN